MPAPVVQAGRRGPIVGRRSPLMTALRVTVIVSMASAAAGAVVCFSAIILAAVVEAIGNIGTQAQTEWSAVITFGALVATFGALYGGVLGPLIGWTLLRHVPIGRAAAFCAAGAFCFLAADALTRRMDDAGLTIFLSPVAGALTGALALRVWYRLRHAPDGAPPTVR